MTIIWLQVYYFNADECPLLPYDHLKLNEKNGKKQQKVVD